MACGDKRAKEESVAVHSLESAEHHLSQQNYGRAFAHFLLVLKLAPDKRNDIKDNFTLALREWTQQLEEQERLQDMFMCYEQACELFPDCETMLNNMGAQLFRLGYADEAACCFRKALKIDSDFLGARENLDNVCSHLVERWHFRMLNDSIRNEKYEEAITAAVKNGHKNILDVGAGTGLLSLFAVKSGAPSVVACEMSKSMYEVACDVLAANQMTDNIHLLHKPSTQLSVPQDLPNKVSLLVTETFDAGLLGEHILDTLIHAWENLLDTSETSPKCAVIPCGATVYICCIESEALRKQNRFIYPGLEYIDMSSVNVVCRTPPVKLNQVQGKKTKESRSPSNAVPNGNSFVSLPGPDNQRNGVQDTEGSKGKVVQNGAETNGYSASSRLGETSPSPCPSECSSSGGDQPGEPWEPYTTERLCHISGGFKMLSDVTQTFHFNFNDPKKMKLQQKGIFQEMTLPIKNQGRIDSIAMWFDLHLDSNVTLTSSPEAQSCWEQAIYPVLPNHLKEQGGPESFLVKPGDSVDLLCSIGSNRLQFECLHINREDPCIDSDIRSGANSPFSPTQNYNPSFTLDRQEIAYLNDLDFNKSLCNALKAIKKQHFRNRPFSLYSINNGFSVLPLQALKIGAKEVGVRDSPSTNQELLYTLASANEISDNMIHVESWDLSGGDPEWDVMVMDIVEPCGCLYQQVLEDMAMARVTCLHPDGVVVPQQARVFGMLIESQSLLADSAVLGDDSMAGFRVAEFMNDFQMSTHIDIDLSVLDYKILTEPFEMFTFDFADPTATSQMPSYLDQSRTLHISAVETGHLTAVVYWFELNLYSSVKVCTLDPKMHWKQAAVMQKHSFDVSTGSPLEVTAVCRHSCIDVKVALT